MSQGCEGARAWKLGREGASGTWWSAGSAGGVRGVLGRHVNVKEKTHLARIGLHRPPAAQSDDLPSWATDGERRAGRREERRGNVDGRSQGQPAMVRQLGGCRQRDALPKI
jgi:hypothetical protein